MSKSLEKSIDRLLLDPAPDVELTMRSIDASSLPGDVINQIRRLCHSNITIKNERFDLRTIMAYVWRRIDLMPDEVAKRELVDSFIDKVRSTMSSDSCLELIISSLSVHYTDI